MVQSASDHEAIRNLLNGGRSAAEIAVELNVPRTIVDIAARVDVPAPRRARFTLGDLLPWALAPEHVDHVDAQMLRLESDRRLGRSLTDEELAHLQDWRVRLVDADAVVTYDPTTGFAWTARNESDRDIVRAS